MILYFLFFINIFFVSSSCSMDCNSLQQLKKSTIYLLTSDLEDARKMRSEGITIKTPRFFCCAEFVNVTKLECSIVKIDRYNCYGVVFKINPKHAYVYNLTLNEVVRNKSKLPFQLFKIREAEYNRLIKNWDHKKVGRDKYTAIPMILQKDINSHFMFISGISFSKKIKPHKFI